MAVLSYPKFDLTDRTTISQRWSKYITRFENYMIAMDITVAARKKAILLHFAGTEVHDIFDNIPAPAAPAAAAAEDPPQNNNQPDVFRQCVDALTQHFNPQSNTMINVYQFRKMKQEEGETLEEFYTKLKHQAVLCNFPEGQTDNEIKSQIVMGGSNSHLRRKALEQEMTLAQVLTKGKSLEQTEAHATTIESSVNSESKSVNAVHKKTGHQSTKPSKTSDRPRQGDRSRPQSKQTYTRQQSRGAPPPRERQQPRAPPQTSSDNTVCGLCGGQYPHRGGYTACPAYGKTCAKCNRVGHFARVCRNGQRTGTPATRANYVQEDPDEYSYETTNYVQSESHVFATGTISALKHSEGPPRTNISIQGAPVPMIIDTGANVNIIDQITWSKLPTGINLEYADVPIRPYNAPPLELCGKFTAKLTVNGKSISDTIYVTSGSSGNLLSRKAAEELKSAVQYRMHPGEN